MVTLPLGVGAYERNYAGEPEVKLVNRFLEVAPTNLRERIALLSRPGTNQLDAFGSGPIRGNYSKPGLFWIRFSLDSRMTALASGLIILEPGHSLRYHSTPS